MRLRGRHLATAARQRRQMDEISQIGFDHGNWGQRLQLRQGDLVKRRDMGR
jgi:hypothetical protein